MVNFIFSNLFYIWDLKTFLTVHRSRSGEDRIIRMNLFHAIAKIYLPQGDPFELDELARNLFAHWNRNIILFEELDQFKMLFGIELQLWKIKYVAKQIEAVNIIYALTDRYLDVVVSESWNEETEYILIDQTSVCFDKSYFKAFSCQRDNCNYQAARRANMPAHEDRHDTERMFYRCKKFGKEDSNLLDNVLPKNFNCKNVVMFDIEALMQPANGVQMHIPVMIACKNNFIQDDLEDIFCRFDMSGCGLKKLVTEFLDKMVLWAEIHRDSMPQSAHQFLVRGKLLLENDKTSPTLKHWYKQRVKELENMMELKILGFNSMKYDTLALSNCLIDISIERYGADSIKCIKKGLGIFNLEIETNNARIAFRDVLSYIPKQSLDKFAVSMGLTSSKLAWPYELYRKVVNIFRVFFWVFPCLYFYFS